MRLRFGGFFFAILKALMQMTEVTGTKQSNSLWWKQKLEVKRYYFSLDGEVSKSPNLSRGSCADTGQRAVPLKSSSLRVCQLWLSDRIESSLDRLGGMNLSISGLNCSMIHPRTSVLTSQPTKVNWRFFFLLIRVLNHEEKPLTSIIFHWIIKINKNYQDWLGLPLAKGFRNLVVSNPGIDKQLLHPRNSWCERILL